jgi:phage terminase large subunit-like protein
LLGDGYIAGNGIQWTCAEPDLVAELKPYIESFGYGLTSRGIQHYIRTNEKAQTTFDSLTGRITGVRSRHSLIAELKRLKLWGTKSHTKFIPAEVQNWCKEDVASLLGGLIATDGSVYKSPDGWKVSYTSVSRDLIEGIKWLLETGFGIYGSTVCKGNKSLQITFGNAEAVKRIAELPVPGRKGRLLKAITFEGKQAKGSLIPFADIEPLGFQPTYDLLVAHPSHIFRTADNIQVSNSGKTEIGAFIATAWALGKEYFKGEPTWELVKDLPIPEKANNVWVVGLDFPTLRDVIWREKLRAGRNHPALIPDGHPALRKKPNDSDFQIFFENGSTITGKSADSGREKFQGSSVDLVWIDEEPDAEIFDEAYQRTVDCAGKILLTLTPLTDIASSVRTPWVFNLYADWKSKKTKDVKFVKLSVLDNPYVPEEEKEKLKEKWHGHPEEQARLYGDFVQRAGLVYPMFNKNHHFIPRREIPRSTFRIACIDPANTGPTACLWMAVDSQGNMTGYRTYKQTDMTISEHAKNILTVNCGDPVDIWLIDPKWGSQREGQSHKTGAQLYREAGIPVRLAPNVKDENGYGVNSSIEYMNATLNPTSRHPKIWFFEDLIDLEEEITRYSWAFYTKGELRGMSKDKPRKGFDDLMNTLQYLCAFRPKGKRPTIPTHFDLEQRAKTNSYYQ